MRTRRYSFKASGTVQDVTKTEALMKDNLNIGPESIRRRLYSQFSYKDDKYMVDRVELVTESDRLTSIEVSAYDWFQKDRKAEIRECVQLAADRAGKETGSEIHVEGNMKYTATDENLPRYLYHLTEKKSLDAVMEEGLSPKRGHNDWKSKKRCTYLTEGQFIVPWLGILDHMEGPVVLEVDTAKLPFVEQGRIWEDRAYVPGRIYSEHRTTEAVPAEALRPMAPEEVAALGVNGKAVEQLMRVAAAKPDMKDYNTGEPVRSDEKEVVRCVKRLADMGVMDAGAYKEAMEAYEEKKAAVDFEDFTDQVGAIKGGKVQDEDIPF